MFPTLKQWQSSRITSRKQASHSMYKLKQSVHPCLSQNEFLTYHQNDPGVHSSIIMQLLSTTHSTILQMELPAMLMVTSLVQSQKADFKANFGVGHALSNTLEQIIIHPSTGTNA